MEVKMKRNALTTTAVLTSLAFLLTITACTAPSSAPAGGSPDAQATKAAGKQPESPAQAAGPCPAFRYYALVDIGMTKDEVDAKLNLPAKEATGEYDPEGAYYYLDSEGYGIYVLYEDGKLTSKTVQYKDAAKDLAPLTEKPVTKDQRDSIKEGMTHAAVVELLGCEGVECSKTLSVIGGENKTGTIYRWGNQDGSFLQVVFVDDDTVQNALFMRR
jgi:hypothetical protein